MNRLQLPRLLLAGFYLGDVDRKDSFREIAVSLSGKGFDGGAMSLFWFTGADLKTVHSGTLAWNEFPGDGTAGAVLEWLGFWAPADHYRLRRRDHQLLRVPQTWYPVNVSSLLTKDLPLRKAPGSDEVVAVVPRGRRLSMITHLIETTDTEPGAGARDTIGGSPLLPAGVSWPVCECGKRMVLFLQFDVRPEFGLPFAAGSHLSVFMCPAENEAPEMLAAPQLLPGYWNRRRMIHGEVRFYELFLHPPGGPEEVHPSDPVLAPRKLRFTQHEEQASIEGEVLKAHPLYPGVSLSLENEAGGLRGLKVGGQPSWAQEPEVHQCCCGAEMRFLCQVPQDWPFRKRPEAPSQPDSFSRDDYCLFLGNETYVFACEAQCDPRALHVVAQN